jgi:hypothetical protein
MIDHIEWAQEGSDVLYRVRDPIVQIQFLTS